MEPRGGYADPERAHAALQRQIKAATEDKAKPFDPIPVVYARKSGWARGQGDKHELVSGEITGYSRTDSKCRLRVTEADGKSKSVTLEIQHVWPDTPIVRERLTRIIELRKQLDAAEDEMGQCAIPTSGNYGYGRCDLEKKQEMEQALVKRHADSVKKCGKLK